MTSTDGTRRLKTYGKRSSRVVVSLREWRSTVNAGSSTATCDNEDNDHDAASPSQHAAQKKQRSSSGSDSDVEVVVTRARKVITKPPVARAIVPRRKETINNSSRLIDISNDSEEDQDKRIFPVFTPSNEGASSSSGTGSAQPSTSEASMPHNKAHDQVNNPRNRIISLSSDTSEEDKIRPRRRTQPALLRNNIPTRRGRIIDLDETPPASPAVSVARVHQDVWEDLAPPPAFEAIQRSPLKAINAFNRPSALGRKDSNFVSATPAASPSKKAAAPLSSPNKTTPSIVEVVIPFKQLSISTSHKEKLLIPAAPRPSPFVKHTSSAKVTQTPFKLTTRKPANVPSRSSLLTSTTSRSSASSASTSRSSASASSSSSASARLLLPPPRGHNSESAVAWRRPITQSVHASVNSSASTVSSRRSTQAVSSSRPKVTPASHAYFSSSSRGSLVQHATHASILPSEAEPASPVPIRRKAVAYASDSAGRMSNVVVEVPMGLPRSRSPAPIRHESRQRQTSGHSSASSHASQSRHSPPLNLQHSQDVPAPSSLQDQPEESLVVPIASNDEAGDSQDPVPQVKREEIPVDDNKLATSQTMPAEFAPLLRYCSGPSANAPAEILDFAGFVDNPQPLLSNLATEEKVKWSKLGEATYAEVFIIPSGTEITSSKGIVVKVIPLHMSPVHTADEEKVEEAFAKAGEKVEEAFTSSIDDLAREIRIFRALSEQSQSSGKGWPGFKGAFLVKGKYPTTLLSAWDNFKTAHPKKSENPRPGHFAANQLYALICMDHAGSDLESVKLRSWTDASTVLWQVALALSEAEISMQFEHRDLHWGNILVQPNTSGPHQDEQDMQSFPSCLSASEAGVSATIIDFTLSRATVVHAKETPEAKEVLSGGFDEDWMFTGEGDYQYECYRIMRRLVQNSWSSYRPVTNVVWLHYLVKKLISDKGLKRPIQRDTSRLPSIKASQPGTPSRPRTRRTVATAKRPTAKVTVDSVYLREKSAHEAILAAEQMLGAAVSAALQALPRSTSILKMMETLKIDAEEASDSSHFRRAGDFVDWWRAH